MIESYPTDQQPLQDQYIGDYRLLHLLGRGEAAEIYLGEHKHHLNPVALKKLHGRWFGDDLAKFFAQASMLSRLRHTQIVPILDFGVDGDVAYLVMQYAPNGSVRDRYPKGTRLPLKTVAHYTRQIASALQYIHNHELIHRDVKPHNMLLGTNDKVLLGDFGIAVVSHSLDPLYTYDFEGTVLYAAPEQLQGTPRRSSDQYALGMVIYEWLCGELPFSGTFSDLVHQHLSVPPPPLRSKNPAISPMVEQTVMKALAKDVTKRFSTVTEFAETLQWAIEQSQPAPPANNLKRQFIRPWSFSENG